jgi:tetratricopeptide (TPR) repeat protein
MRTKWIIPAVALVVLCGCAQNQKKATIKEKAAAQWNGARANVMISLASDQYKAGNFDKARQTVEEAIKLTPDAAPLRILSARIAIEQGQLDRADKDLGVARKVAPGDGEADYLSGVVCQRWQKLQEASDFYAAASTKSPTELSYLMAQSEMLVGMDRADEALALLQARVVFFEHSGGIRDAVARLMMAKGNYREAVELFRQATILTPEEKSFREGLGLAQYYAKQYSQAATVLGALIVNEEFAERADLRIALADSQLETGKPRDARDNLEVAARLQPANAAVWVLLARAALETDDLKRAESCIRKAIALKPDSGDAYLLLGYLRLRQDKLPDSLQAFIKASALDGRDSASVCLQGYVLERMGRGPAAMACYARALNLNPADKMASQLMASVELHD